MTVSSDQNPQHAEVITPIAVPRRTNDDARRLRGKRFLQIAIIIFAALLLLLLWFVLTARTLVVVIEPLPDYLSVEGDFARLQLRDRFLLQPGEYRVQAEKAGYYPLDESLSIGMLKHYHLQRSLRKLPGIVSIDADPVDVARVYIDDRYVGVSPLRDIELTPGSHKVELQRYRYRNLQTEIQIDGALQPQQFNFELTPNWAMVSIDSSPSATPIWIDREEVGVTPVTLELDAGTHLLEIVHPDYAAHIADFVVLPDQALDLGTIELGREPSFLLIQSTPATARVSVNQTPRGVTPVTIPVMPNQDYRIDLSRDGYRAISKTTRVAPGESKTVAVQLQPILGVVDLQVTPVSASVMVDGKLIGKGSQHLSLTTTEHEIVVSESGYESYHTRLVPTVNQPQSLQIDLELRDTRPAGQSLPASVFSSQGHQLKLIRGGSFTMGASRREQGRRANESLRKVTLQRLVYIADKETSNVQFREFDAMHRAGAYRGVDLNADELPVVNVSWQQAAAYCNWLSRNEDLPLEYVEQNGALVGKDQLTTGYRLLTEAEWAWIARTGGAESMRYAWGNEYPPTRVTENFADQNARRIVGLTIPGYDDGFAGLAPVGSFPPNTYGLFDVAGNAAEWMHDFYTIYSSSTSQQAAVDPTGPKQGKHRVIRGASWLRGTLSNTRLAYRDYRDQPRADVGFRIARYAE